MAVEQAVAEKLRRKMLSDLGSGGLAPGARLGSERKLAEHYGVSRATLRQVLAALEEAGLVHRVTGRSGGTFISHAKVDRDLNHVVGVPAYLARQGYAAGSRILSTQIAAADETTRSALQLNEAGLVVVIRRIRLADGIPISLDHAQFPADRFPGLLEMPLGGSLYELLEQNYATVPCDAEELVEVVNATHEEAQLLSIESGAALLSITRSTSDSEGVPFEFSCDLFRADRTRITMHTPGRGLRGNARHDGEYLELTSVAGRKSPSGGVRVSRG